MGFEGGFLAELAGQVISWVIETTAAMIGMIIGWILDPSVATAPVGLKGMILESEPQVG